MLKHLKILNYSSWFRIPPILYLIIMSYQVYNILNLVKQKGFCKNFDTKFYAYEGNILDSETAFILTVQGFKVLQFQWILINIHYI